jgi:predicted nuclease of predicted toxin-antitoxin system
LQHKMHIVLDANLSWRLVEKLKPFYEKVEHVENTNLKQPATDHEIWSYARQNEAIIITNDDDFSILSALKGFPPKVVLLKTGNQSNNYLLEILVKHQSDIEMFNVAKELGLLEII